MKRAILLAVLALPWSGCQGSSSGGADYDPAKDPVTDLSAAVSAAGPARRRIILEVGNEGCVWCDRMHRFIAGDQELRTLWENRFVVVPVYMGPRNWNQEFLKRFPQVTGTPHLFGLSADGSLLHSQAPDELEAGDSYDREKLLSFLSAWAPLR